MIFFKKPYLKMKRPGFTLIEVLVATVISVAMMTLVMASFWTLWQTYRTSELLRDMQHEATFALTRISDKVRNYGVDYAAYVGTSANVNHNLWVKDTDLNREFLFRYKPLPDEALFLGNYTEPDADLDPMFSHDKFAITELRFSKSPDNGAPTRANSVRVIDPVRMLQPQVSIYFKMVSRFDVWGRPVDPADALSLEIQTSISSRNYDF